jgi:hypothetical protein
MASLHFAALLDRKHRYTSDSCSFRADYETTPGSEDCPEIDLDQEMFKEQPSVQKIDLTTSQVH